MAYDPDEELKGSETRLWQLIDERSRPGADVEAVDRRIWNLFGEEWAVVFTDLSGFSRKVAAFGIVHFLQIILENKKLLLPIVQRHDGILVKIEADSFLIIFRSPVAALRCAIEMQHACQRHNSSKSPEEQVPLCLGIGTGRILRIGDRDVWGQEVNAASKLGEDIARADEILVTGAVRRAVGDVLEVTYEAITASVAGSDDNYRVLYRKFAPAP